MTLPGCDKIVSTDTDDRAYLRRLIGDGVDNLRDDHCRVMAQDHQDRNRPNYASITREVSG